ncbi:activating signal cointegrator 1 complex subunit 1 [Anabas testudineus]|uniref:K Homology domain-containing protein n=1 Tax=Anabas testudineus TaxID=64144 RepID=A0A3Q1JG53_ANATE|nr:activating signal cointegrator 1 complex subunit 1 [Anabas testudineus]XP_026206710.1 activating signal cointegrator 1 complex subunit 1 [Anabas testudineus]XP_026206711.1 activating signal cointegrator 1 complex subunit 1 [Anabas testudineus]XP_026206712.1 activating signal cointegrator 1 complex subunit 1 [Anabas testudineus]XP_026206713.1 activating signal cointegrator 1 complex subunit 1 [Anabas testudineus]
MDILRPPLINIDGRMYRRNIIKEEHYQEEEDFSCMGPFESEELAADETCDSHFIEQTDKGYRCAIDVPSVLYKYVIGKKGETRRRLESDTKTSISIPKQGVEGQIVITGSHKSAVSSAVTRIEVLVESFRRKQPFTHFLSFPLNDAKIQQGFLKFKEEVLQQSSQDHGVEESIFQNPAKLHLTVGTLSLLNDMEVNKAREHLQECQSSIREITEGKPLPLEVCGIEYMNDDPAMVDVLYAKVSVKDGSDKLQVIADRLVEHFVSAGLMVRQWDRVKLHGTVMNTLFRKDSTVEDTGGPGRQTTSEREAFDARNILKKFDAYCFGEFELNTALLSQRYSTDCTGYYTSAGSIRFS